MASGISPYNANDPYELLIAQIVRLEREPQMRLKVQRSSQEKLKGIMSDVNSKLSTLHSLSKTLKDQFNNPFRGRAASVSDTAIFTATAGDEAALGTHSLDIRRLASTDNRLSRQYTSANSDLRSFFDTNGSQTFTINVAHPTDADPDNREAISVTVDPTGTTNEEILAEINTAINDQMKAALDAGTIDADEAAASSIVRETSSTARLSLRSGQTGYANRLEFTDSANGLLSTLQLNRADLANSTTTVTSPATAATFTGPNNTAGTTTIQAGVNDQLEINVNGTAYAVTIAAGSYSRADLATAVQTSLNDTINGAPGGTTHVTIGVSGSQLQATTAETGSSASLQVTGGTAVGDLGWTTHATAYTGTDEVTETSETAGAGGMVTAVGTSETDSQLNSVFVLNGLTLFRNGNTVTDALTDVTLKLKTAGEGAKSFTIGVDSEGAKTKVKEFIGKYNEMISYLKNQLNVDPDTKVRGPLAGDSTFRNLRFGLRDDATHNVDGQPSGGPFNISEIGIKVNEDGTLELTDSSKFTEAMEKDSRAVESLFGADDGIATRMVDRIDRYIGTDGIVDDRKESIDGRLKRLNTRIDDWDTRLQRREDQLRAQFAQLQKTVAVMQGQGQYLSQFMGGR